MITNSETTFASKATDHPAEARQPGFATRAIHYAYDPADHQGSVAPPVNFTSTYAFASVAENEAAAAQGGMLYAREYNPTTAILEARRFAPTGVPWCLLSVASAAVAPPSRHSPGSKIGREPSTEVAIPPTVRHKPRIS